MKFVRHIVKFVRHKLKIGLEVIPYKDANGLIQACQIRLLANDISSNEKRYCWLSSPQERRATSSGTPIHFTFFKEKLPLGETVLITDGALKADTVVRFRSNARMIATLGVTCSHSELVKASLALIKVAKRRASVRFVTIGQTAG
jgi:hypothetical protein